MKFVIFHGSFGSPEGNWFPQLKEKRSAFSYQMFFYRTYDDFEKLIKKMKREKLPLPLLMYLVKEDEAR